MSAIAEREPGAVIRDAVREAAPVWQIDLVSLEAAEAGWRQLETIGAITPYQCFDWVAAYSRNALASDRAEPAIITVTSPTGKPLAVLPFAVRTSRGMRTVSFIGGKHANFHMGVFDRGFMAGLDASGARQLLALTAAAIGRVDAFILHYQPLIWDGIANPFALLNAQPSPSQAYKLPLLADCDATLQNSMSSHARKKHKNKRARFAELGPSQMFVAETPEQKERILEAFLRQKTMRFAEMGVPDVFAEPGLKRFLRVASGLDGGREALCLAALELNGTLVATYVGARAQGRFTGMATSFEPDPKIMKVSPGEILLVELIRRECRSGMKVFDLGVGEARYKATICNETEDLVDSFVAMSARGRLAVDLSRLAQKAKGAIKKSPLLYSMMMRIGRMRQPIKPQPSSAQAD
ncbi:MAG: GNAT family N-acetyltransferase [Bosea sp. (in: a-proteobacteria)]